MTYFNVSRKYGVIAGIGMALYLAILGLYGDFGGSFMKFLKYFILVGALYAFFNKFRPGEAVKRYISYHVRHGGIITLYAALITVLANIILYWINPEFSTAKFNLLPSDGMSLAMVSFILFIEIMVLGMLCTFVIFPLFKPQRKEIRREH